MKRKDCYVFKQKGSITINYQTYEIWEEGTSFRPWMSAIIAFFCAL